MRRLGKLLAAAACAAGATLPAAAQQVWTAVPDASLASMRGGFALGSGLVVSFGIARTVQVDREVVSQTSFRIDDLQGITPQQAAQLAQVGNLAVVQRGAGNRIDSVDGVLLPGLVIQNSESNRQLQALTVIDVSTNSLRMLRDLDLGHALSDALKSGLAR